MLTEADTCRKYVVPKLQGAGWDNDPHSIAEQRFFTDGRITVRGSQASRQCWLTSAFSLQHSALAYPSASSLQPWALTTILQSLMYAA